MWHFLNQALYLGEAEPLGNFQHSAWIPEHPSGGSPERQTAGPRADRGHEFLLRFSGCRLIKSVSAILRQQIARIHAELRKRSKRIRLECARDFSCRSARIAADEGRSQMATGHC